MLRVARYANLGMSATRSTKRVSATFSSLRMVLPVLYAKAASCSHLSLGQYRKVRGKRVGKRVGQRRETRRETRGENVEYGRGKAWGNAQKTQGNAEGNGCAQDLLLLLALRLLEPLHRVREEAVQLREKVLAAHPCFSLRTPCTICVWKKRKGAHVARTDCAERAVFLCLISGVDVVCV
eukprot:1009768-Rhodomonas_salina.1